MRVPHCQQVGSESTGPKSSVFYCNINETTSVLSPVESLESESSLSPPEGSLQGQESPQIEERKKEPRDAQELKSPTTIESGRASPSGGTNETGQISKSAAVRPVNLSLPEGEQKPPRLKRIVKMKQAKREGRLLSVPNLKFAKNDQATVCDLTSEESTAPESFTCNLIRRFSKCLKARVEERFVSSVCAS